MKTLTVITTTYNRGYCLHQIYASLCRQSSKNFLWLIIDDGSSDNTRDLVVKWKTENLIEIEYYYQDNGGMHKARNSAYERVKTELNVIVDSDDWLCDDTVEKIITFWEAHKSSSYYGIIALNISKHGELIGSALPENIKACTLGELFGRYKVRGDKKIIMRSDLSKLYPFPEFEGEKFYPPSYKYRMLDQNYTLLIMNAPVCVVDYNPDSMSYDKFSQYKSCAKGFAHFRNETIKISHSQKFIIKQMIHYIAESKLAGNSHYIIRSSKPLYAILCWPVGLLYYYYLINTKRKY